MAEFDIVDLSTPGFVVAFFVPNNGDNLFMGIITGPGFDTGTTLVDLYEVDQSIQSFTTIGEALAWLEAKCNEDDADASVWPKAVREMVPGGITYTYTYTGEE